MTLNDYHWQLPLFCAELQLEGGVAGQEPFVQLGVGGGGALGNKSGGAFVYIYWRCQDGGGELGEDEEQWELGEDEEKKELGEDEEQWELGEDEFLVGLLC